MTDYILSITGDLLLEIFNNPMYQIFVVTFLFAIGLNIFKMIRTAI